MHFNSPAIASETAGHVKTIVAADDTSCPPWKVREYSVFPSAKSFPD